MSKFRRYVIKVGGESGQGINSVGEILSKALKTAGYKVFAYREYPSLIKGGVASFQVEFSDLPINSPSANCDILVCISRYSINEYLTSINPGGKLIHSLPKMHFDKDEQKFIDENQIIVEYVSADEIAIMEGGNKIMANVVLIGLIWKLLGEDYADIEDSVLQVFGKKEKFIEGNKKSLSAGFQYISESLLIDKFDFTKDQAWSDSYVLSGSQAFALGTLSAGVKAYYSYPMTPSSPVLTYLASVAHRKGILVKQVEDEISAVQMAMGSMFMGARAMTGTSGGGFDLMTETVSNAGIAEIPLVILLAQRHGAATGLPTWTGSSDLNLALYAGHGEFPRCVVAVSDPISAYQRIQEAFNIAEKYQLPVIVMTDKEIAESLFNIDKLPSPAPIKRGLVDREGLSSLDSGSRYEITGSGLSQRWLPGQPGPVYNANSDEHDVDGDSTESAEITKQMVEKRARKLKTMADEIPEPEVYGVAQGADISFIGWGSIKTNMVDLLQLINNDKNSFTANYLHYEYLWPFKSEALYQFVNDAKKVVVIENNATGQLGGLISREAHLAISGKLLKYDGRPFFIEELVQFVEDELGKEIII